MQRGESEYNSLILEQYQSYQVEYNLLQQQQQYKLIIKKQNIFSNTTKESIVLNRKVNVSIYRREISNQEKSCSFTKFAIYRLRDQGVRQQQTIPNYHLKGQKMQQFKQMIQYMRRQLMKLPKIYLDQILAEQIKRNAFSSEYRNSKDQKNSEDGLEDETQSNSKLRDTQLGKEQSLLDSKRTSGRHSPKSDNWREERQQVQTATHLNSIDSSDNLVIKNYFTSNEASRGGKAEKRNSLPTTPTQSVTQTNSLFPKQQQRLQSNNEKEVVESGGEDNKMIELSNDEPKYQSGRKNLMLQRAQLQKLDQYFGKREEIQSDNFIQEEEEDDDDIVFRDSFIVKSQQKSNEVHSFEDNCNELSIIKQRNIENIKQPLTSSNNLQHLQNVQNVQTIYNIQNIYNPQNGTRQRHSLTNYKSGQSKSTFNEENDIMRILNQLDQQDTKIKAIATKNFAFNSLKQSHTLKKSFSSSLSQSTIPKFRQTATNPLTENYPPINKQNPMSYDQLKSFKIKSTKTINNFFSMNHQVATKSSNLKQRSQLQDVNQIMNQNFLQDIKDLKKRLSKQTCGIKALNI